jgi:4-hydroxybenzoate polyprenyltransferase
MPAERVMTTRIAAGEYGTRQRPLRGATRRVAGPGRWVVYQRERFPLLQHAPLIAAFAGGAVLFSAQLRAPGTLPGAGSLAVAFASCLLFFFQLRVADEHKDAEEDARFRPYRPVPRGLVGLGELRLLAIGAGIAQAALALSLAPALLLPLALVWAWIGLMTKEFWLREWLATRPLAVIATHMLVMPLIDLYATACDWLVAGASVHAGLRWFLVASFFNGVVIEIGRKVRAPEDEEAGVLTYTVAWGRGRAIAVWLGAMLVTGACAVLAARELGTALPVAMLLGAAWLASAVAGGRFLHAPTPRRAAAMLAHAGAWTVLMYLAVGLLPLVVGR